MSSFLSESVLEVLLSGSTVILALGCVAMATQRSPIHRQRVGEITIAAVVAWLLLTLLPLPRWSPGILADIKSSDFDSAAGMVTVDSPSHDSRPSALGRRADRLRTGREEGSDEHSYQPATRNFSLGPPRIIERSTGVRDSVHDSAAALPLWRSILLGIYLVGVIGCSAWFLLGRMMLSRMMRRTAPPPVWLDELSRRLPRGKRAVRVLVSAECGRPLACGLRRPTIVLPQVFCGADHACARQVLLHELAHLRQGDVVSQLLFNLVTPLLYFHPLYWWLRGRVQLARELVADDWAARQSTPAEYARQMVMAVDSCRAPCYPWASCRCSALQLSSYRRISMLLHRAQPLAMRCSRPFRILSSLVCLVLLGTSALLWGNTPGTAEPPVGLPAKASTSAAPNQGTNITGSAGNPEDPFRADSTSESKLNGGTAAQDPRIDTERKLSQSIRAVDPFRETSPLRGFGGALDLVALANSCSEAVGAMKIAKARWDVQGRQQKAGTVSAIELATTMISYETAKDRVDLLRDIIALAMNSAKSDLEVARAELGAVKAQFDAKSVGNDKLAAAQRNTVQAETNLKILDLILQKTK